VTGPISRDRLLGSLKEAASWPGVDRNTVVTLATSLVAARADAEGSRYFQDLAERNPADATARALAGFFQVRAGHDVAAALIKLDKAATMDLGLSQYFRGLALAGLLPSAGLSEAGSAATDTGQADQVIADLEYLVTRDDFIARLYHQRTGYWQPDGQGLDPQSQEETAAALDLLAGEKADAFAYAAASLADQGDLALALEIITPGLLRHPDSSELAELREAVLVRLMEQRQLLDPFGFLVYAELAGAEFSPVG
jgi:hypothetical protein